LTYKALAPTLKVIAPWREWDIRSREDALDYAATNDIPVSATTRSIYSRDRNLWHFSHEGGPLEDPAQEPEESLFLWTASPEQAPDQPELVEIGFNQGVPASVNKEDLGPSALVERLNAMGARHGIGRVDMVENRLVGVKSRGVYETPGGTILSVAHRDLESICLDRDTLHFKELIALRYAELIYYGKWFTPLREALGTFIAETQATMTGWVRMKLYKGSAMAVARYSPYSLYREDLATFGADDIYDQSDAKGFIDLFGLQMKVRALMDEVSSASPELPVQRD
jgi:argininosuccinate synthase